MFGIGNYLVRRIGEIAGDGANWQRFRSLTTQEKNILYDIATLGDSKVIAESRHISIHTLRKHKENIRRKTDCRSDLELIRFADAFMIIENL
jgi:DNA-binding CsgD family transcriptional regulator